MRKLTQSGTLVAALAAAALVMAAGCSDSDPGLTKQQVDNMRHPTAVSGYKGPDPNAEAKIGEAMAAFNKKHQNDKVEFVK